MSNTPFGTFAVSEFLIKRCMSTSGHNRDQVLANIYATAKNIVSDPVNTKAISTKKRGRGGSNSKEYIETTASFVYSQFSHMKIEAFMLHVEVTKFRSPQNVFGPTVSVWESTESPRPSWNTDPHFVCRDMTMLEKLLIKILDESVEESIFGKQD